MFFDWFSQIFHFPNYDFLSKWYASIIFCSLVSLVHRFIEFRLKNFPASQISLVILKNTSYTGKKGYYWIFIFSTCVVSGARQVKKTTLRTCRSMGDIKMQHPSHRNASQRIATHRIKWWVIIFFYLFHFLVFSFAQILTQMSCSQTPDKMT